METLRALRMVAAFFYAGFLLAVLIVDSGAIRMWHQCDCFSSHRMANRFLSEESKWSTRVVWVACVPSSLR